MRRFVYASVALLALVMVGQAQDDFQYTEWDAWNAFGKGSSVTMHMKNDEHKMESWTTTWIDDKNDKEITLKGKSKMKMAAMPDPIESDIPARKVTKQAPGDPNAKCPQCDKPGKDHAKPKITTKDGEIAGKKVKLIEMEMTNCKDGSKLTMVFSKDIPGWQVEIPSAKMKVSDFEVKK